jgi:integrase
LAHTFATDEEAWDAIADKKKEIREGEHVDSRDGRMSFRDYSENVWKSSSSVQRLRPLTRIRDFGYLKRYLLPAFGDTALCDLNFESIDRWLVELGRSGGKDGNPLAPSTVKTAGQLLSKILKEAIKSRRLKYNPCKDVSLPRPGVKPMNIAVETEIESLAESIDGRYRAIPLIGCHTGLRASELFGLRWRNVHFELRCLDVVTTTVEGDGYFEQDQPTKSPAGRRRVPLSDIPAKALRDHRETHPGGPDDYVFTAPRGGPVRLGNFRKRIWYKAVASAGVAPGFDIHDMRNTAISLWIAAGADVLQISTFAGHTSVAFTLKQYGHLFPHSGDAFIAKLNAQSAAALELEGTDPGHNDDEELAEIVAIRPDLEELGGASKNRTYDLSIISAAL